jgi:hypothetical protein
MMIFLKTFLINKNLNWKNATELTLESKCGETIFLIL